MARFATALLLLALAAPTLVSGQAPALVGTLQPGARVRITTPGAKARTATVVAHTGDTLMVRWPQFANAVPVPVSGISRLDVSTGRHRRVLKGAGLGTLVGGATGGLLAAISYSPCEPEGIMSCFLEPENRGEAAAWGTLAGGTLGLVVGTLAGLPRRESWQQVSLGDRRVALAVTPRARDTRLGVSVQF